MRNRVFITGCGIASPLGCGLSEFYGALEAGMRGTAPITCFDASLFPVNAGGEARRAGKVIRTTQDVDRKAMLAEMALEELLTSCGGRLDHYPPSSRFMSVGTGIDHFNLPGYVNSGAAASGQWHQYSPKACRAAARMAARCKAEAGLSVNAAACVASTQAIGLAFRIVSAKPEAMAFSGGFDSMLSHMHYMGFYKLGALSDCPDQARACKPFSKNRSGLVIGEGAAMFALESENNAAPDSILAEIAGYASTMDAGTVTDPDPSGEALAEAALSAIKQAGMSTDDIDCVHMHETGTRKNAVAEAAALYAVFGRRAGEIPVFSLKGQTGHLIGACGAVETAAVIHSLRNQCVLPTVNFEIPDPEVPLNVVTGRPLRTKIRGVLKLNAAFGGQNAALVFRKYDT